MVAANRSQIPPQRLGPVPLSRPGRSAGLAGAAAVKCRAITATLRGPRFPRSLLSRGSSSGAARFRNRLDLFPLRSLQQALSCQPGSPFPNGCGLTGALGAVGALDTRPGVVGASRMVGRRAGRPIAPLARLYRCPAVRQDKVSQPEKRWEC